MIRKILSFVFDIFFFSVYVISIYYFSEYFEPLAIYSLKVILVFGFVVSLLVNLSFLILNKKSFGELMCSLELKDEERDIVPTGKLIIRHILKLFLYLTIIGIVATIIDLKRNKEMWFDRHWGLKISLKESRLFPSPK